MRLTWTELIGFAARESKIKNRLTCDLRKVNSMAYKTELEKLLPNRWNMKMSLQGTDVSDITSHYFVWHAIFKNGILSSSVLASKTFVLA